MKASQGLIKELKQFFKSQTLKLQRDVFKQKIKSQNFCT